MSIRDHQALVIDDFNGLWIRGDIDSVPQDHFSDGENIDFFDSGFRTRDGLQVYPAVSDVLRMYNFNTPNGNTLLILTTSGSIYHSIDPNTIFGPILTIPGMDDFNFAAFNGYAYITPITRTVTAQGNTQEVGMADEVLYVYAGDGTPARPAAGEPPTGDGDTPLVAYNSTLEGEITPGIHYVGVSFSDGADDSTAIGTTVLPVILAPGDKQATVQNIPIGGVGITERKIWMTHAINPADFDPSATYTFYLAKTIADNTTVSDNININDIDLTVAFVAGTLPNPTSGGIEVENTATEGFCDLGLHVIGVVYETESGYLTAPGPEVLGVQTFVNENRAILVSNIPVSPSEYVIRRHLVSSKAIQNYNGDDVGYQLFFIPEGTLDDNTSTELEVSYYDIDLLEDASHLIDNFSEIPASAAIGIYNNRLVIGATNTDISTLWVSAPGEPEAINQVDGVIIIPLDGNPITAVQEFRDVLYTFKQTRTYAITDNGEVPSSWIPVVIDQGVGSSIHGIATVLDSGGVNIDYLLIADYSGIMQFNGAFIRPEMSWKIQDYWLSLDRNFFGFIQFCNDSLNQKLYLTLPNKRLLYGNYQNGLNPKDIKWMKWRFDIETTTIALMNTDVLFIGAEDLV